MILGILGAVRNDSSCSSVGVSTTFNGPSSSSIFGGTGLYFVFSASFAFSALESFFSVLLVAGAGAALAACGSASAASIAAASASPTNTGGAAFFSFFCGHEVMRTCLASLNGPESPSALFAEIFTVTLTLFSSKGIKLRTQDVSTVTLTSV